MSVSSCRRLRVSQLVAAAMTVVALVACGAQSGSPDVAPGSSAPSSAAQSISAAAPVTSAAELGERMVVAMQAAKTAAIAMEGTGALSNASVVGVVQFSQKRLGMALTITSGDGKTRIMMRGDTMFVAPPEKVNGKTWARLDANGTGPMAQGLGELGAGIEFNWSRAASKMFYGRITSFRADGNVVIDGETFAGYTLGVKGEGAFEGESGELMMSLDSRDLPRRLVTIMDKDPERATTVNYTEWGAPVTIKEPAPADVTDRPTG